MTLVFGILFVITGFVLSGILNNKNNQKRLSVKMKNRLHLLVVFLMLLGSVLVLKFAYIDNTVQLVNVDKTGSHFTVEIQK